MENCTAIDTTTPTGLTEDSTEYVRLRPATAVDASALALIGSAAFLEAFTWMLPGPDIIDFCSRQHTAEVYTRYLVRPETRITLAETATGAPVGYAMLAAPDFPTFAVLPSDIELKRIYLLSRFRSLKTPVLAPLPTPASSSSRPEHLEGDGLQPIHHRVDQDAALAAEVPASEHPRDIIPNLRAGQALMDTAIADARAMGYTRLLLGTHAGNERAISFYRRNGFTEAGTRTFQVGAQCCCDYILSRPL